VESKGCGEEQLHGILEAVEIPRCETAKQQRREGHVRVLEPRAGGEASGEGERRDGEEG